MVLFAQVDNPDPGAHYPVVLAAPAAPQRLAFLPAALDARPVSAGASALSLRAAVWRRRPAGVLCVERIEVCDPGQTIPWALSTCLSVWRLRPVVLLCVSEQAINAQNL